MLSSSQIPPSFRWPDYLIVARHLNDYAGTSDCPEACLRAAISRAYYAALNTGCTLLRDEWGIEVPSTAEVQRFVPQWFLGEDDVELQRIGILLERLRDRRRRADYEGELADVEAIAARCLVDAEAVIRHLSSL